MPFDLKVSAKLIYIFNVLCAVEREGVTCGGEFFAMAAPISPDAPVTNTVFIAYSP